MTFVTVMNLRYLAAHDIARSFVNALHLHFMRSTALTGATPCHASMARKIRRLKHLEMFPEVAPVFIALSNA